LKKNPSNPIIKSLPEGQGGVKDRIGAIKRPWPQALRPRVWIGTIWIMPNQKRPFLCIIMIH